jgi:2-polyprenyl-6-hydroxyphenyl methylase/3-demethylubiquinone-9 3-methyltransferase
MKRVTFDQSWPDSWKDSYKFDLEEIYGAISNPGYAYLYHNRKAAVINMLQEVLAPGARVLDMAAGQGNFSLLMAELGYSVTWNDLRADLADYVRLKHEFGTIDFAPGNAFDLQFQGLFDAVLIAEVIEHVAHPDEFLRKVATLVRPKGYVLMTTPNGGYLKNRLPKFSDHPNPSQFESIQFRPDSDGHIFLLHRDEVASLAYAAELEVDKLSLLTNPLTAGHLKTASLLRILPDMVVQGVEAVSQRLPLNLGDRLMAQLAVRFKKTDALR